MEKRERIKLSIVVMVLVMGIAAPVLPAQPDSYPVRLPVHIETDARAALPNLAKEDILLFVNGSQQEIRHLGIRTRNINKTSDLSRHFILSFHMQEFDPKIMAGIEYFTDNLLDRFDTLTVLTPVRSYRLQVSKGKAAVYDAVEKMLKKDCEEYRLSREALASELGTQILQVARLFGADGYLLNAHTLLFDFYNYCRGVIEDTKLHFLSFFAMQDRLVDEIPPKGDGEIWWIHFQQRGFEPVPSSIRTFLDRMINLQNAGGIMMAKTFDFPRLYKQMSITGQFPGAPLQAAMLRENICYNVIFWGDSDTAGAGDAHLPAMELETLLAKICRSSGGVAVTTTLPAQGLIKLQQHEDRFYQLEFNSGASPEPLEIRVLLANQKQNEILRLSYPQHLGKEKLLAMRAQFSGEKVKIIDFNIEFENKRVGFAVTAFHPNEPDLVGLLRIRAELYDDQQIYMPVFSTGNILHAASKKVRISLPLPKNYTGQYTLRVSVCDMIANQLEAVERPITL